MKKLILFLSCISLGSIAEASSSYADSSNRVLAAVQAIHGSGGGVGAKNQSCLLCHASASGGPGNLNTGFGTLFSAVSASLGFGSGGGNLVATGGSNSLEAIFSNSAFADEDSDGDGQTNAEEFAANTDPADNIGGSSGGGDSGGGCGTIGTPGAGGPGGGMLLLLLPLALITALSFRNRRVFA